MERNIPANFDNPAAVATDPCVNGGLTMLNKTLTSRRDQQEPRTTQRNEACDGRLPLSGNECEELPVVCVCPPTNKRRRRNSTVSAASMNGPDSHGVALPTLDVRETEELLRMYPLCSHCSTPEVLARLLHKEQARDIAKRVNNQEKTCFSLDDARGTGCTDEEAYQQFTAFAKKMDDAAETLKSMSFASLEDAQLILCHMIRSYAQNLCARFKQTYEGKKATITTYVCGSLSFPHNSTDACKWKATVKKVENADDTVFKFARIDSFLKHNLFCLECRTRFTTVEVNFQAGLLPEARALLMTDLNQFMVREGTYAVRRFRKKRSIIAKIDASLRDEISRQTIDPSVTDLDLTYFTLEPTEDTGDEHPKKDTGR